MASPGIVRFAATASVLTTGAAACYFLSEGGDPEKLESNLRETRARIHSTVASARAWTEQTAHALRSRQAAVPAMPTETDEKKPVHEQAVVANTERTQHSTAEERPQRQTGPRCHTCSGPRIWFFAEKLRLKRRITPYPDPPRD